MHLRSATSMHLVGTDENGGGSDDHPGSRARTVPYPCRARCITGRVRRAQRLLGTGVCRRSVQRGGAGVGDGEAALAARFHDGTSDLEVVQTIVAGDVVCVVAVEWNTMRFDSGAGSEPRPWILRTTNVLRRDAQNWTLLHHTRTR